MSMVPGPDTGICPVCGELTAAGIDARCPGPRIVYQGSAVPAVISEEALP